jgi:hypothetical protein
MFESVNSYRVMFHVIRSSFEQVYQNRSLLYTVMSPQEEHLCGI